MPTCIVRRCGSCSSKKSEENGQRVRYFSFPRDKEMQDKWLKALKKEDNNVNVKNARVCSRHFEEKCLRKDWRTEMYNYYPMRARSLVPESIPTLNLGYPTPPPTSPAPSAPAPQVPVVPSVFGPNPVGRPPKRPATVSVQDMGPSDAKILKLQSTNKEVKPGKNKTIVSISNISKGRRKIDLSDPEAVQQEFNRLQSENKSLKMAFINRALGEDYRRLEEENRRLKLENKNLKVSLKGSKTKEQYEQLEDEYFLLNEKLKTSVPKAECIKLLSQMFTPGQIRAIFLPVRRTVKWSAEDISAAITLRSVSVRAYQYLKTKRNIPLPGQSTLRKWMANMKLEEGILESVLHLMSNKAAEMEEHEKLVSLSFGEADLSNKLEPSKKTIDKRVRTHQCAMVRGLFATWKQPIYYTHDQSFTKEIILKIIDRLHQIGFTVVSIVSEITRTNLKVWSDLKIGIDEDENCYFPHPNIPNSKVFVFTDAPFLLKSLRNLLLESGIDIDGKIITKDCIERVLNLRTPDMKIAERITQAHLRVVNCDKQRVRLAVELLSDEVAKAIEGFGVIGELQQYNWRETADFIKIVYDWFKVFNYTGKIDEESVQYGLGYGASLDDQITKLEKMTLLMGQIRSGIEDDSMINIQKCVIMNNCSLSQLFIYLGDRYATTKFPLEYILTNRLNMDVLVQLFAYLISRKDSKDKYSPLDFKYRLRWYMLGESAEAVLEQGCGESSSDGDKWEDKAEILTKDLWQLLRKRKGKNATSIIHDDNDDE
uniref:T_0 protein n=1 Tax=Fopius arisanus TaxID=64838 RepID=A0A0C9PST5_9HYME